MMLSARLITSRGYHTNAKIKPPLEGVAQMALHILTIACRPGDRIQKGLAFGAGAG